MRRIRLLKILVLILFTCGVGCGKWPPVVESIEDIDNLPESTTSLRARGLSDSDIRSLARFSELLILDFSGGHAEKPALVTDAGLEQLAELYLPKLHTLTLGYCTEITDDGLRDVSKLTSVTWLSLMACPQITDDGLGCLLGMESLKSLDLRGCTGITDAGLEVLAQKQDWHEIMLGGCMSVTDAGVAKLRAANPDAIIEKDDAEWLMH